MSPECRIAMCKCHLLWYVVVSNDIPTLYIVTRCPFITSPLRRLFLCFCVELFGCRMYTTRTNILTADRMAILLRIPIPIPLPCQVHWPPQHWAMLSLMCCPFPMMQFPSTVSTPLDILVMEILEATIPLPQKLP